MTRNFFADFGLDESAQALNDMLQNQRKRHGDANFVIHSNDRPRLAKLFGGAVGPVLWRAGFDKHNCQWHSNWFGDVKQVYFEVNWPVLEAIYKRFNGLPSA